MREKLVNFATFDSRVTIKSFTSFSTKWPFTNLHCFAFNLYLFSLSLWFFVLLTEIINFWHHSQYGKWNYKSAALPHNISHTYDSFFPHRFLQFGAGKPIVHIHGSTHIFRFVCSSQMQPCVKTKICPRQKHM